MRTNGRHDRPNVVLILIDTLRADHLSCYGYERRTSPCIDRIAEQALLYERAISSAAWTPPSHASLFTGCYPSRHGVDRSHLILDSDLVPLPEALKRNGYRTYGVSSNYWLSRETRFDRGFDEFVHSWQLLQTDGSNAPLKRQQRKQHVGLSISGPGAPDRSSFGCRMGDWANEQFERVTKRLRQSLHAYDDGAWRVNHQVRRWLPKWRDSDQPFFAFLHYMEPHIRYAAPGRYRTMHVPRGCGEQRIQKVNQDPWRYLCGQAEMNHEDFVILRGLYDGEVSYVDQRVGQVYDWLRNTGLLENTLVIITSDHGENLGEHHLMDHAYCLYDTLLRVPLIVRGPGELSTIARITQQVQTLDLFATCLRLAGVNDREIWNQVQGETLFPSEIRGDGSRVAIAEYLEPQPSLEALRRRFKGFDGARYDRTLRMVRDGSFKYILGSDGRGELYDLKADSGEEHDLIMEQPTRAAELRAALDVWLRSFKIAQPGEEESLELDDVTRRRLEDLGYLS